MRTDKGYSPRIWVAPGFYSIFEYIANNIIVINRHMSIDTCGTDIAVASSITDLRKAAASGKGVAAETVPPVVDRQQFYSAGMFFV